MEDLEEMTTNGDLKYILTSKDMKSMNFEFWSWLSRNFEDVTILSGLPFSGELRVYKLLETDVRN